MKKTHPQIIILLVFIGLFAFNVAPKKKESIQGAWILVEGKMVTENEVTNYPGSSNTRHMKLISDNHFSTIWQDAADENSGNFNGGFYTFSDGIFTETLTFFSDRSMIGETAHFKIRLDKDRLYLDSCDENGNISDIGFFEVWKKANEGI